MNGSALSLTLKPRLSFKAKLRLDAKSGKYVLLYPEKGLLLNATGAAIVKLCEGQQSLSEIVSVLAEQFRTEPALLQPEVLAFVQILLDRGLLEAAP